MATLDISFKLTEKQKTELHLTDVLVVLQSFVGIKIIGELYKVGPENHVISRVVQTIRLFWDEISDIL